MSTSDIRQLQDQREWLWQAIEAAGGKVDGGGLLPPNRSEMTFRLNGELFSVELTALEEGQ